MEEYTERESES